MAPTRGRNVPRTMSHTRIPPPSAMQSSTRSFLPSSSGVIAPTATSPTTWPIIVPEIVDHVGTTQPTHGTVLSVKPVGERPLVLHTRFKKEVDSHNRQPVQFVHKVASIDKDKVLFLRRSSDWGIPSDYFIHSTSLVGDVVRLPRLPDKFRLDILSPESIGLLVSSRNSYQVAHLSVKANQNTGWITQGTLHLWEYSASSSSSRSKTGPWTQQNHEAVTLPLVHCTEWHTHRVISFGGTDLLWVDLRQGILRLRPSVSSATPTFDYFELHKSLRLPLEMKKPPEMTRSFGCCNTPLKSGCCNTTLKFVNLCRSGSHILIVDIWDVNLKNNNIVLKHDKNISRKLNCRDLWDLWRTTHTWLPEWPDTIPIFPTLSKDKSHILYLTVSKSKNEQAWLLEIDMLDDGTLKGVADYPGYRRHTNPPFPAPTFSNPC